MAFKAAQIKWFGPKVVGEVQTELKRRLKLAAVLARDQVVKNISKSTTALGPSRPGEFPHADTGRLRNSIFWSMRGPKELSVIVGTDVKYGLYLEVGTSRMKARPYLLKTIQQMRPELKNVIMKGKGIPPGKFK